MKENIYKHLIQLSLSFSISTRRLFDLISSKEVVLDFEQVQNGWQVCLTYQGQIFGDFQSLEIDCVLPPDKRDIICATRAFYNAASKMCGFYPEWGIIDGVKPVRLYLNLTERGINGYDTIKNNYLLSAEKASLVSEIGDFQYDIAQKLPENSYNLYISIPFCPTRCKYCSFICADASMSRLIPDYLDTLCEEIRATAQIMGDMKLNTVYIGGGTPTVLDEVQLERLLKEITDNFDTKGLEFTLEAGRPDTVTPKKMAVAHAYGVNRVSINTQTTNDKVLQQVGRHHTARDYFNAFEMARTAGIGSINTDLIAGFENDTFEKTLSDVISLKPENLTIHTLCVKNSATLRDEGFVRKAKGLSGILKSAMDECHTNGYFPYYLYKQKNAISGLENIGYSKKGFECIYNICMMSEFNSTVALGAGGATKMVYQGRTTDRTQGFFDCKYPKEYIESSEKRLTKQNFLREFVKGVTRNEY